MTEKSGRPKLSEAEEYRRDVRETMKRHSPLFGLLFLPHAISARAASDKTDEKPRE
jgi:hypothetical protein